MASLLSESDALNQVKVKRRQEESARPETIASGSQEEITVVSGNKGTVVKQRSFFVRGSILFNPPKPENENEKSKPKVPEETEKKEFESDSDTLTVEYICREFSAGNMLKQYETSALAKIYNILAFGRTFVVVLLVCLLANQGLYQSWALLAINFVFLVLTMMVGQSLEFRVLVMVREVIFLFWSIMIVLNAIDDRKPKANLFFFWIISLLTLTFRFIIMVIELVIFVKVVQKS